MSDFKPVALPPEAATSPDARDVTIIPEPDRESPGFLFAQSLAKRMFAAYNAAGPNPGKTWNGQDVPPWENCGELVQAKWTAAAIEAARALGWVALDASAYPPKQLDPAEELLAAQRAAIEATKGES